MANGAFDQAKFLAGVAKSKARSKKKKEDELKQNIQVPKIDKPIESVDDRIARQIRQATAAGNLEDVATLKGLQGGSTQPATGTDLKSDLLKLSEKAKIADIARSTNIATRAVTERGKAIEPRIKGLKSQASVATQLGQKRLKDLFTATGAAVGTGAARQIASETALTGQLGKLDVQKEQEQAQVSRDLSDIQSEKAFLENQVRTGTATQDVQFRLDQIVKEEADKREGDVQEKRDFASTINRFAQDFTAEINRIQEDGDPSNDWQIPLLESARQEKLTGIASGEVKTAQDAEDRAFTKWQQGIPLNQEEMDLLGTTRSTKPVKPSGGSGSTQVQLFNQADKKVNRGIPLSAAEAAVYGVEPGFVDPNFKGLDTEEDEVFMKDSDMNFIINEMIDNVEQSDLVVTGDTLSGEQTKDVIIQFMGERLGQYSGEQGDSLALRYGLNDNDMDRVFAINDLQGSQGISPPTGGVGGN